MKWIITILTFVFSVACFAQEDVNADLPQQEHINLVYDKPNGCYSGDTIRFRVSLNREAQSRVVYVELLHPNRQVIISRKLKLDDNLTATGTLPIDTLYGSGFYEIRAYTRFCTNFYPSVYPHFIIPVYCSESIYGKEQDTNTRYISTNPYSKHLGVDLSVNRKIVFNLRQPVEKELIVFGRLAVKPSVAISPEDNVADKMFHVVVTRENKGFTGEAITDSLGHFAIKLPDTLKGEWNLFMYEKRTDVKGVFATKELIRFMVQHKEDFIPALYRYEENDFIPKKYGFKKWKEDKKHNKANSFFFNCDKDAIDNQIKGYVAKGFYSWLGEADGHFLRTKGIASPTIINVAPDSVYSRFLDLNFPNGVDSNDPRTVCVNGPSYQGRPIVWIVNGEYRMVTGLNQKITDFQVLRPSRNHIPQYLDEVRNVFLTEDPSAFYSYLRCSVLQKKKPVTLFINTHEGYIWNDSALMTGHFRGYDN